MKTILITGSTDGIGLATAQQLLAQGHHVLIHGRTPQKVERVIDQLSQSYSSELISGFAADLSDLNAVTSLADEVSKRYSSIDVLINNAGVFKIDQPVTDDGHDARFIVNTIAPYLLMKQLKPALAKDSRVINLASAAQAPVDIEFLLGNKSADSAMSAYAQSKLALIAWTRHLATELSNEGILIASVNPGSLLATKMVKDGFGVAGNDISQGADILIRAALSDEFSDKAGEYFDNDSGAFAQPDEDSLNPQKNEQIVQAMDSIIQQLVARG
ncbi:SDR family NAD(P)-dependent oxidoreductase [Neptuniibacter sp. QD48_55]|uniref:SDR family NAD(P)-dependent oxidoreductase n=1 Tax=Neptuniibacter sp. QD48_55 TaxID=3398212 RepID=UPI0039F585F5